MSNYNNSGAEPAVSDIRAQSHRGNGALCGISKRIKLFLSKTLIRSMSRGGPNVCNLGFIWGAAPLYLSYFSRACDLPSLSQSRYRAGPGVATLLITHFAHEGSRPFPIRPPATSPSLSPSFIFGVFRFESDRGQSPQSAGKSLNGREYWKFCKTSFRV